jgi:hypothetical protein
VSSNSTLLWYFLMTDNLKRKNDNAQQGSGTFSKRQRRATRAPLVFEQGVNPAPPTPPLTARKQRRSQYRQSQQNAYSRGRSSTPAPVSPLCEPTAESSQLAVDAQTDNTFETFEDDNAEEEEDPLPEEEEAATMASEHAASATGDSPGVAAAAAAAAAAATSVASSSQSQRQSAAATEEVEEEPKLHFRWRACWGTMEKNLIPSASRFARNKHMYTVSDEKLWRWADGVVKSQKPRGAKIESLTATLYYTGGRQAKGDRCTTALQRRRLVAGEDLCFGNWSELIALVEEMDKESSEMLKCDFDLVLSEEQQQKPVPLSAEQPVGRSTVRARPGIVTAIQEEGLAGVVTAEHFATGSAIGIKDHWRCREECCGNYSFTCWIRRVPGRLDRFEDHYKVSGNLIASWAQGIERKECTVEQPSDEIRLSIMLARDRADAEKKRRRRKVSPTSSNSSIEGLTKAILAGHLAQITAASAPRCNHHSETFTSRQVWMDFDCPHPELAQHTYNFFKYWERAMPQYKGTINEVKEKVFKEGKYNINMLMDEECGMTMEVWVNYFRISPGYLSHLRRKAHDWKKDYGGLTRANYVALNRAYDNATLEDSPEREVLGEISGN